ncbi:MAG: class I SAM-dependent methyltransferase [bacterium]|nr:class I SAM-dependent methyltransferase [bacterium]
MNLDQRHPSSFRDPSGFVFLDQESGVLLRQINTVYREHYDAFISSGLYQALISANQLVAHEEVAARKAAEPMHAYKIIKPKKVPFISYPFEWSFSQLQDAALLVLAIQQKALERGMTLKDASAYNIQFVEGRPILIDTLSFEKYISGRPWIAYRQFCQHFLAPLALMSYTDIRLSQWFRVYLDGIPLDLASKLLPRRTYFSLGLLAHIHLHAKSQHYFADKPVNLSRRRLSVTSLLGLIDNLMAIIKRLYWDPKGTEWGEYYTVTNYADQSFEHKKSLVGEFLEKCAAKSVWDVGANEGVFSRIASGKGITVVSFDYDPAAVEKNYRWQRRNREKNILPLLIDITNPSPSFGWANQERDSLLKRGPVDCAFVLALIHHLRISNNIPFQYIARFFRSIAKNLIIEFVPKSDSQVHRLLATRPDIFPDYTRESFEFEFKNFFTIMAREHIAGSERTLYLMRARSTTGK